ncbi:DUF6345 domain-containing protein [Thermincola ferriacetica]
MQDSLGWTKIQYEVDPNPDGTTDAYNPVDKTAVGVSLGDFKDSTDGIIPQADQGDLLYFMGHAYSDRMLLKDELTDVHYTDIGTTYDSSTYSSNSAWDDDLEWIILGACSIANRNYDGIQWAKTLMGSPRRAHGIYGYQASSPSYPNDYYVATKFFANAAGTSPQTIWSSWINANNYYNATNWGVIEHSGNRDYLWGKGTVTSDTTGAPVIYQYQYGDDRVELLSSASVELSNSSIQTSDFTKVKLVGSYNTTAQKLDEEVIIDQFYADEQKNQIYKIRDKKGDLIVEGPKGSKLEILHTSGAIKYSREIVDEVVNFDYMEARAMADKFLETHGGKPADAFVWKIRPLEKNLLNFGTDSVDKSEKIGYLVEYKRKVDNILVDGYNGDSIRVLVDNQGVANMHKLWRNIDKNFNNDKKPIVTPEIAQTAAINNVHKIWKVPGKADNSIKTDLVYFSKSFMHDQTVMEPAWRVEVGKDSYIFVNAYSGEIEDY